MKNARVDDNHAEIVAALRKAGAQVQSLATVGSGCPDILVAFRGVWYVMEIKDGSKPPSAQKLTPYEEAWHARFDGHAPVWLVHSVDDALTAIGTI